MLGGGSTLQVPSMVDEEERTKLSIKQKAAELSKKTRSSFRRSKNTSGGSSRRNRRILTPGERLKASKSGGGAEDKGEGAGSVLNAGLDAMLRNVLLISANGLLLFCKDFVNAVEKVKRKLPFISIDPSVLSNLLVCVCVFVCMCELNSTDSGKQGSD